MLWCCRSCFNSCVGVIELFGLLGALEKSGPHMDLLLVSHMCLCPNMETQWPICLGIRVLPRRGIQGAAPVLTQVPPSSARSSALFWVIPPSSLQDKAWVSCYKNPTPPLPSNYFWHLSQTEKNPSENNNYVVGHHVLQRAWSVGAACSEEGRPKAGWPGACLWGLVSIPLELAVMTPPMLLSREDLQGIHGVGGNPHILLCPSHWDRTFCTAQSRKSVLVANLSSSPSHSQFKCFECHVLCQGQVVSLPKEVPLLQKLLLCCCKVLFPLPFSYP